MAVTQLELNFTDPLEVELLAVFRGLQFCATLQTLNIVVESNYLLTVQALDKSNNPFVFHTTLIA